MIVTGDGRARVITGGKSVLRRFVNDADATVLRDDFRRIVGARAIDNDDFGVNVPLLPETLKEPPKPALAVEITDDDGDGHSGSSSFRVVARFYFRFSSGSLIRHFGTANGAPRSPVARDKPVDE